MIQMTLEKIIEYLTEPLTTPVTIWNNKESRELYTNIRDWLVELYDLKNNTDDRYIPIILKVPDEGQDVWVSIKNGSVQKCIYTSRYSNLMRKGFLCENGQFWSNDEVFAWMPCHIPKPYEPGIVELT